MSDSVNIPDIDDSAPRSRYSWLPFLGFCMLAWLVPMALFLNNSFLIGYDAYYHVQLALEMAKTGPFLEEFPWATESIWADAWFDKEWLFHVLMIPFVKAERVVGAKVFIALACLSVALAFGYLCRVLGLSRRRALVATALMPWLCYGVFWLRLVVCRPHVLSIAITCLAMALIIQRRPFLLAALSLIYALSYTGHWQLPGWVLLYDLLYLAFDERGRRRPRLCWKWPLLPAALAGMAIGEVLHPGFPANIHGLYVQNILVLAHAWGQTASASEPILELKAAGWQILWLTAPLFLGFVWIGIRWRQGRLVCDRIFWFLGISTAGYLALSVLSFRFVEYLVPIATAFLARSIWAMTAPSPANRRYRLVLVAAILALSSLMAWGTGQYLYLVMIPIGLLFGGLCWFPSARFRLDPLACLTGFWLLLFAVGGTWTYYHRYVIEPRRQQADTHLYADAGAWIRENLEPGTRVFSTRFAANSILWFHAPEQRYLVFLDPIFMRQRNKDRYLLWQQIRHAQHPDPVLAIQQEFGAEAVFLINPPTLPGQRPAPESRLARQLELGGARRVSNHEASGAQLYELPPLSR